MTQEPNIQQFVSEQALREIDQWIAKYPENEKQSAVLSALRIVQSEQGFLTEESMKAVAYYLGMAPASVYEVATFYTLFELKPTGKHLINVCTNISCKFSNCDAIVNYLENKLGIKLGETTTDGRFTLRSVECLAACVNAPMMQIDTDYHLDLTPEKVDAILEQYS